MGELLASAKGLNGQLEVYEEKVVIKRKGFMAVMTQGFKGDKEIFIKQISSIQFKKANLLSNGYMQFTFSGGIDAKGGSRQAVQDENTIMFTPGHQEEFIKCKDIIEKNIINKKEVSIQNISEADEIEKLAKLKDTGIISEEEFIAKKKKILGI